jgi:hypothetical protein
VIRVTAKRAGFRRCGVAFASTATDFPASKFTADQLKRLQAEPMLVVQTLDSAQVAAEAAVKKAAAPTAPAKDKSAKE